MPETLTFATPVTAPSKLTAKLIRLDLQAELQYVLIQARANTGEVVEWEERGAAATTLLSQLNTANLTLKSLQRRALEYLATKRPELAGTVSGTPD